jgi:iron(III) transport system ATP-binding protein
MAKDKKSVRLDHISKIYQDPKTGKDFYAVKDVNLTIEPGSFVTLLGPSGCGKTTILRMIAGFESPDEGEIYLDEQPINALTPNQRDTAMVFQSYALLPHYNIFDNVAYGLKLRKMDKETIRRKVVDILGLVGLEGMEDRMTNQLSGGQQQRVALARALVIEPGVLLFDEPLSNLDAKLRVSMRTEIRRIQQEAGITAIYVTHDQSEAMAISDQIIIMKKGLVDQIGDPHGVYYHPVDEFVADFIGETNFLRGTLESKDGDAGVARIEGCDVGVEGVSHLSVGACMHRGAPPGVGDPGRQRRPAVQGGAQPVHGQLPELPRARRRDHGQDHRLQPQEQENLRGGGERLRAVRDRRRARDLRAAGGLRANCRECMNSVGKRGLSRTFRTRVHESLVHSRTKRVPSRRGAPDCSEAPRRCCRDSSYT